MPRAPRSKPASKSSRHNPISSRPKQVKKPDTQKNAKESMPLQTILSLGITWLSENGSTQEQRGDCQLNLQNHRLDDVSDELSALKEFLRDSRIDTSSLDIEGSECNTISVCELNIADHEIAERVIRAIEALTAARRTKPKYSKWLSRAFCFAWRGMAQLQHVFRFAKSNQTRLFQFFQAGMEYKSPIGMAAVVIAVGVMLWNGGRVGERKVLNTDGKGDEADTGDNRVSGFVLVKTKY